MDSLIKMYEDVLKGNRKKMEQYTWDLDYDGYDNIKKIIRYIVLDKYKFNREDVLKLNTHFFRKIKLATPLARLNNSPFQLLSFAIPELEIKPWEMEKAAGGTVTDEKLRKEAIRWLINEKLKWDRKTTLQNFTGDLLVDYGLGSQGSLYKNYDLLNEAFPEWDIKPWDLNINRYWTDEQMIESARYLILEKLKWDKKTTIENLTQQTFIDNGLTTLTKYPLHEIINKAIPEWEIMPRELNKLHNYWTLETIKIELRHLVFDVLKWDRQDVLKKMNAKVLIDNGFSALFDNYTIHEMLSIAFPEWDIKPWELSKAPQGFWNEKTIGEAVRWLIEEKLHWPIELAEQKLSRPVLAKHKLSSLGSKYSRHDLLKMAYPDKF